MTDREQKRKEKEEAKLFLRELINKGIKDYLYIDISDYSVKFLSKKYNLEIPNFLVRGNKSIEWIDEIRLNSCMVDIKNESYISKDNFKIINLKVPSFIDYYNLYDDLCAYPLDLEMIMNKKSLGLFRNIYFKLDNENKILSLDKNKETEKIRQELSKINRSIEKYELKIFELKDKKLKLEENKQDVF